MLERIKALSHLNFELTNRIRQHLHQFPELSFKEIKTTAYILKQLSDLEIECERGPLETGVVGIIRGRNASVRTIALRADIDALPIHETNTTDYASKNEGVMHACGHDVHTACLLGAAAILNFIKLEFEGTIKFIFQPGEEVLPGGAKLLIEKGVLKNPDVELIFGQHVHPSLPAGQVGFKSGVFMASTDELHIKIIGKGGHAAMPNDYSNPIVIAAKIIDELTTYFMIKSDSINAINKTPTVFAIGDIKAEGATNVIPEACHLKGTFRTMDENWRKQAHIIIHETIQKICNAHNAKAEVNILEGYPVLFNHEALTEQTKAAAELYLGKEQVIDLPIRMTAEDFAYYSQEIPACFYRLGTNFNNEKFTAGVHTSQFDIDPHALEVGSGLMAWLAYNQLSSMI
jgi:amidohydrolase